MLGWRSSPISCATCRGRNLGGIICFPPCMRGTATSVRRFSHCSLLLFKKTVVNDKERVINIYVYPTWCIFYNALSTNAWCKYFSDEPWYCFFQWTSSTLLVEFEIKYITKLLKQWLTISIMNGVGVSKGYTNSCCVATSFTTLIGIERKMGMKSNDTIQSSEFMVIRLIWFMNGLAVIDR